LPEQYKKTKQQILVDSRQIFLAAKLLRRSGFFFRVWRWRRTCSRRRRGRTPRRG
jgi:hypothetical protein